MSKVIERIVNAIEKNPNLKYNELRKVSGNTILNTAIRMILSSDKHYELAKKFRAENTGIKEIRKIIGPTAPGFRQVAISKEPIPRPIPGYKYGGYNLKRRVTISTVDILAVILKASKETYDAIDTIVSAVNQTGTMVVEAKYLVNGSIEVHRYQNTTKRMPI